MMHKVWNRLGEVLFKLICQISRFHRTTNRRFWPNFGISGLQLQFEFTDGYEMMHKVWSSIEEGLCCFSKWSANFKVTQYKNSMIFTWIERFLTVTPVWSHKWLWNAQSLASYRRGALLNLKVICQMSRSHGTKNYQFWPELSVSWL